jgi:hypothetical protein
VDWGGIRQGLGSRLKARAAPWEAGMLVGRAGMVVCRAEEEEEGSAEED